MGWIACVSPAHAPRPETRRAIAIANRSHQATPRITIADEGGRAIGGLATGFVTRFTLSRPVAFVSFLSALVTVVMTAFATRRLVATLA